MEPAEFPETIFQRRQELSIDQALSSVGEFGAGQRLQLCVVRLPLLAFGSERCCDLRLFLSFQLTFCTTFRVYLFQAGVGWIVASLQLLLVVFAGVDPVSGENITCLQSSEACLVEIAKPHPNLCVLPEDSWEWTKR